MSLNWDLTGIENYEDVCFDVKDPEQPKTEDNRSMKPETDALIWMTMFTGIGWKVTDENIDEFVRRVQFYEAVNGPNLRRFIPDGSGEEGKGTWEPSPLSEEVIRAHVGLATNVSAMKRSEFVKRQAQIFFADVPEPSSTKTASTY